MELAASENLEASVVGDAEALDWSCTGTVRQ